VVGRGLACADIDLDGDPDVLIFANGATPLLLRNDTPRSNNVIRLVLRGSGQSRSGSNYSGIGAKVEAHVGDTTLTRMVRSGSSYLSQSELPLVLGLRQANEVQIMTIRWPSGKTTKLQSVAANQVLTVDEGKGLIKSEPFQSASSS
jgi:hypothetical protein